MVCCFILDLKLDVNKSAVHSIQDAGVHGSSPPNLNPTVKVPKCGMQFFRQLSHYIVWSTSYDQVVLCLVGGKKIQIKIYILTLVGGKNKKKVGN